MPMVRKKPSGTAPFGDLNAPPDSIAYAVALKTEAQGSLNAVQSDALALERWIAMLRAENRYRRLEAPDGGAFLSWEAFCTAPQPFGLGYSSTALTELIAERKAAQALAADPTVTPLATHEEAGKQGGRGKVKAGSDATSFTGRGATYLVRRLKRDAPEIADALGRGEYPSARAAAKAAGIIRERTTLESLQRLWVKAAEDERAAFVAWVDAQ
jgi:hypothetical protein